jgi:TRAP-type C4-dicarboxylate transport system substrate-binding protein
MVLSCSAWALALLLSAPAAEAKSTLRFATLAPKNSTWGKIFVSFKRAIEKRTQERLELRIYYNGVLGSEATMAAKLRSGQLDGATLSNLGLAHVDKRVMVMTLPWLVDSWEKFDRVRPELAPEFDEAFRSHGLEILGWGDIGLVYGFTRGYTVRVPTDMRGHHPMILRDEPVGSLFFENIKGVRPVVAEPMEILNLLRVGRIDSISAPALVAEQLQWVPYLDHVSARPLACAVGASVMRKESLDALPVDVRDEFVSLAKKVGKIQGARIRKLDLEAYQRIRRRMTVISVTEAEREQWAKLVRLVLKRLGTGTYPRALMDKVAKLTGHELEW